MLGLIFYGGICVLIVFILVLIYFLLPQGGGPNPFSPVDFKACDHEIELDQEKRDKVLKQGFTISKVPQGLDAIVIGSGMGGLTAASLLAKTGKKVLILEQHDQAGGCCHTFEEEGFEFDVGIHYIGGMGKEHISDLKVLVDQVTDGKLDWVQIDKNFDTLVLTDDNYATFREYRLQSPRRKYVESLKEYFPGHEGAVDKWIQLNKDVSKSQLGMIILKLLPHWFARFLVRTRIIHLMTKYFTYASKPLEKATKELAGGNPDLQCIMQYNFGDYGTVPDNAPLSMQTMLTSHFWNGGFYPRGGASEIAYHMIPIVEAAGGKVLVRAPVSKILVDDVTGAAYGVSVGKGSSEYEIRAPVIISDAGLVNTYKSLLPDVVAHKSFLNKYTKTVGSGHAAMSLFVGLDGTPEELGQRASNWWCFTSPDVTRASNEYLKLSAEEAASSPVPLMFVSFPAAKDPTFQKKSPGKSCCTVVTLVNYEWFAPWEKGRVKKRGDDYEGLKKDIARILWSQVCKLFPQLEDKVEYFDVGSPLTNNYYIGAPRGEIYGLDHSLARFSAEATADLRAQTDTPGLYLTGQDVMGCGFAGAAYGGLVCASSVLNRNLFYDMFRMRQKGTEYTNRDKKHD